MQPFAYARPSSLDEAVALLAERGPEARVLAGGTDLIIRLRDGSMAPSLVVDVKRIPELAPGIRVDDGRLVIGATTVMTDIARHPLVRRELAALADAAAVVGSVQVRNRATHGVLKLTLGDSGYDWQFVPIAGKTFSDSGNGTCH